MGTVALSAIFKALVWAVPGVLGILRRKAYVITVCSLAIVSNGLAIAGQPVASALLGVVLVPLIAYGLTQRVRRDPEKLYAQLAVRDDEWASRVHDAEERRREIAARYTLLEMRARRAGVDVNLGLPPLP